MQRNESGLGAEPYQRQQKTGAGGGRGGGVQAAEIHVRAAAGQKHKQDQQKGRPEMGGNQVCPARRNGFSTLPLEHHQEKRGQGHDLPGYQKQHGIAGRNHQQHAHRQEVEKKPSVAQIPSVLVRFQVGDAVNCRQRAYQGDHQRKKGGQAVHPHVEGTEWDWPGQEQILGLPGDHHSDSRYQSSRAGERTGGCAQP